MKEPVAIVIPNTDLNIEMPQKEVRCNMDHAVPGSVYDSFRSLLAPRTVALFSGESCRGPFLFFFFFSRRDHGFPFHWRYVFRSPINMMTYHYIYTIIYMPSLLATIPATACPHVSRTVSSKLKLVSVACTLPLSHRHHSHAPRQHHQQRLTYQEDRKEGKKTGPSISGRRSRDCL